MRTRISRATWIGGVGVFTELSTARGHIASMFFPASCSSFFLPRMRVRIMFSHDFGHGRTVSEFAALEGPDRDVFLARNGKL